MTPNTKLALPHPEGTSPVLWNGREDGGAEEIPEGAHGRSEPECPGASRLSPSFCSEVAAQGQSRAHSHSPGLGCVLQVSRESIFNKMNSSNLACVFGLNLIWPSQGASSLSALVPLNLFTELLIEYYGKVFSAPEARGEPRADTPGQVSRAAPWREATGETDTLRAPSRPPRPPMAAGTLR